MRTSDENWSMKTTLRDPNRKPKVVPQHTPHEIMRQSMLMRSTAGARAATQQHDLQMRRDLKAMPPLPSPPSRDELPHGNYSRLAAGTMRRRATLAMSPELPEWPSSLGDKHWMTARSPALPGRYSYDLNRWGVLARGASTGDTLKKERKERAYERMLRRAHGSHNQAQRPSTSTSSITAKLTNWSRSATRELVNRPGSSKSAAPDSKGESKWSSLRHAAGRMLHPKPAPKPVISAPIDDGQIFLIDRIENLKVQRQRDISWAAEKFAREEEVAVEPMVPNESLHERVASESAKARMTQLQDFIQRHPEHDPISNKSSLQPTGLIGRFSQATHKSRPSKGESNLSSSPMSFACRGEYNPQPDEADPFASDSEQEFGAATSSFVGLGIQELRPQIVDSSLPGTSANHMNAWSPLQIPMHSLAQSPGHSSEGDSAFLFSREPISLGESAYRTANETPQHTPRIPRKPVSRSNLQASGAKSTQGAYADSGNPFTDTHAIEAYIDAVNSWHPPPSQVHRYDKVSQAQRQTGPRAAHDSTLTVGGGMNGNFRVSSWMTMNPLYRGRQDANAGPTFAQRAAARYGSGEMPAPPPLVPRVPRRALPSPLQLPAEQEHAERDTAFYGFYDDVLGPPTPASALHRSAAFNRGPSGL